MSILTGNKFDPNTDVPDLAGKTFIVTGGSAGIGFGIVAHLLQHNAKKILLLSMKEHHAEEAMEELKQWGDASRVHWVQCNLEDLKGVDETAKKLHEQEKQIDALICNAGLGVGVYNETKDGIDSHFQVNHLSQFHLAMTLLPNLQATPRSRLVFQSSDLHRACPSSIKFESLSEINQDIGASYLYNRTKLAQVLFVRALKRRQDEGKLGFRQYAGKENLLYVNATHPGAVSTDQQKQAEDAYGTVGTVLVAATRPFMSDPVKQGCRPALFAATSQDVVDQGIVGEYIIPDRKVSSPSSQAQDVQLGENLWKLSVQLLKEKLGHLPYDLEDRGGLDRQ